VGVGTGRKGKRPDLFTAEGGDGNGCLAGSTQPTAPCVESPKCWVQCVGLIWVWLVLSWALFV
jgi:hypothetical protein